MNPVLQFDPAKERLIRVPESYFTQVLSAIDDHAIQKITLFSFWLLEIQERDPKYLTENDFLTQSAIQQAFKPQKSVSTEKNIRNALEKTVQAGILLQLKNIDENQSETIYFINSPKGRAAAAALANGDLKIEFHKHQPVRVQINKPNIFKLYEDHIGAITPMMAEFLQDAEEQYSVEWIRDAFEIAVAKNARNWRYIEAILKSWQEKGKDGESRQNTEKPWQKYLEGEYGDVES
ncbi:MAG: DnaD domain protein [Anaerolineaceae bacterium]|nr:DnaD domain protein [Anaerolineaceae bacterium]